MSQSQQTLHEAGKYNIINNQGSKYRVTALTIARTLTAADTGSVFMLSGAAGFAVTLPAVATAGSGWTAKFINTVDFVYTIVSPAADIKAAYLSSTGGNGASNVAGFATITLAGGSVVGDSVEIICNGTNYFAMCRGDADAGITFA